MAQLGVRHNSSVPVHHKRWGWTDFTRITAQCIGFSSAAGADPDDMGKRNGKGLPVLAVEPIKLRPHHVEIWRWRRH